MCIRIHQNDRPCSYLLYRIASCRMVCTDSTSQNPPYLILVAAPAVHPPRDVERHSLAVSGGQGDDGGSLEPFLYLHTGTPCVGRGGEGGGGLQTGVWSDISYVVAPTRSRSMTYIPHAHNSNSTAAAQKYTTNCKRDRRYPHTAGGQKKETAGQPVIAANVPANIHT